MNPCSDLSHWQIDPVSVDKIVVLNEMNQNPILAPLATLLSLSILGSRMVFQSPINTSHLKTERKTSITDERSFVLYILKGEPKLGLPRTLCGYFQEAAFFFGHFNFRKISHNYKRLPVFLKKRMSLGKIPPVVHHLYHQAFFFKSD